VEEALHRLEASRDVEGGEELEGRGATEGFGRGTARFLWFGRFGRTSG
jgi:hypothetical protein